MSFYDMSVETADGSDFELGQLKGQVVLVVNVASQCGFTPQYAEIQELYAKYRDKGFCVMGFPCNQFGKQEPGSNDEIQEFCSTQFHVTFPVMAKIEVNGVDTAPVYNFLKESAPGLLGSKAIKWNFTKFLVDRSGKVVKRFAPMVKPKQMEAEIEAMLSRPA